MAEKNKETYSKLDLEEKGLSPYTAKRIFRDVRILLVKQGFPEYQNKRINVLPKKVVDEYMNWGE